MSTLRITPRAATLATGHSVGAGQVSVPHHHIAHLSAGADETVKWRGVSDAGRGISDFGNAMLKISAVLAEERNEMQLDEFEADFNARVTAAELDKDKGFLTRHLANTGDLEKLATEGPKQVKDIFDEVAEAHGMTGVKRSWAENRVRGRVSSVEHRIANRVATTHQALKVQAATRTTASLQDAWRIDRDDEKATLGLIDAFRAQQYAAGAGDDAAELAVGQFVNALAVEYAADKYGKLATAEEVDAAEKQLEENPAAILSGNDMLAKAFEGDKPGKTFDPAAAKRLKGVLSARRHEIEAAAREREAAARKVETEAIGAISLKSNHARARGGLVGLEKAIGEMAKEAANAPEGSRIQTAALVELKRLDAAADAEAMRLTWDGIFEHAGDKEEWKPPKGSRRMEKHYRRLKESFDRQAAAYKAEGILAVDAAVQEERKATYATLRAAMLDAAAVDPGGFSARLAEAAEKGHVTLDQYRKLRDEFRDVWTKEGMPQKGAALVQILKNEFYAGRDYDLNDRLAVNPKTGRFEYVKNPDTKKPFEGEDVEFKAQVFVPYSPNDWYGWRDFLFPGDRAAHYETETRTITSDEQLKMLDWAMELAQHDGEWITTDPQTGAKLDKPRKLDAAAEFQDACSRLRTSKRAQESQDLVLERANAMLNLRAGFAQADDAVTGAASKREAMELKARETLKSAKRKPFAPKMPGGSRGESAASEGEED